MINISKNRIKVFIYIFICILVNILFYDICFSKNIGGEDIWMEWTRYEFDNMSYGAVSNTTYDDESIKVYGYGRYQFKNDTNLIDFLEYLDKDIFRKWIEYGKGSDKLDDPKYGLQYQFADYYTNHKEDMINKQDMYIYEKYYVPIKNALLKKGYEIANDERLKGAILSYVVCKIWNNEISHNISSTMPIINDLYSVKDNDTNTYIKNIYKKLYEQSIVNSENEKRYKSEMNMCLDNIETEYESKVGELLIVDGSSLNANIIQELHSEGNYFDEFLNNYKFYSYDVNDWWDKVRTSISYKEEFDIDSGYFDFKTSTSHGLSENEYSSIVKDEVALKIPRNNTDIYYIPQNSIDEYSNIKFGINNVAQAGGSLSCLSMAINKLLNNNENNLILPSHIIDKIKEIYDNDYNHYYDKEKKGVKTEMIYDVLKWYRLNSNIISGDSIYDVLGKGHPIIARVKNSEFTENGQFILLAGLKSKDGKVYIVIHDPNIYHVSNCYKLYTLDYIVKDCQGSFIEVYKSE